MEMRVGGKGESSQQYKKENHQYSKAGRTSAPQKQNRQNFLEWRYLYLDKGLGYTGMCIQQKMISYNYNVPV